MNIQLVLFHTMCRWNDMPRCYQWTTYFQAKILILIQSFQLEFNSIIGIVWVLNLPQLKIIWVFLNETNDSPNNANHGQAPFAAVTPPIMRNNGWFVVEGAGNPHPSSGVSKRPLMSDRTSTSPKFWTYFFYFCFNSNNRVTSANRWLYAGTNHLFLLPQQGIE